jgi:hypothetical protein
MVEDLELTMSAGHGQAGRRDEWDNTLDEGGRDEMVNG